MRAEYKTVCVKFRIDDSAQMRAWEYLRKHVSEKPYSALIADMVSAMTREGAATDSGGRSLPPADATGAVQPESGQAEGALNENEIPQKFLDFVLGMGGDPDEDE